MSALFYAPKPTSAIAVRKGSAYVHLKILLFNSYQKNRISGLYTIILYVSTLGNVFSCKSVLAMIY